jgi:excisionase family DNA binding protein
MEDKELYTTSDLAKAAAISRERVRQLVVGGKIEGHKVGQSWAITREEARRWLAERGVKEEKGPSQRSTVG